jgi:hypothetical protein
MYPLHLLHTSLSALFIVFYMWFHVIWSLQYLVPVFEMKSVSTLRYFTATYCGVEGVRVKEGHWKFIGIFAFDEKDCSKNQNICSRNLSKILVLPKT